MNLDRLTELRKRKIGLFNIRLTVSASPKARTPGMNQDTGVRHSKRWARLPICLTRRATIYWGAPKKGGAVYPDHRINKRRTRPRHTDR